MAKKYVPVETPTPRELHMLNRMGTGFSAGHFKQLRAAGGETAWFEAQLDHETVPEHPTALAIDDWFPTLRHTPVQIWTNDQDKSYNGWEYGRDLCNATLQRRACSNRPVFESMVELWSNHLHVNAQHFPGFTHRIGYDRVIREHALGTFEDLLVAATLHPAMLLFLDNWRSVKNKPNENHGRELLELHTVGRDAGYTEAMVKDSAKILSGYTVVKNTWEGQYDASKHTTGAVSVLGFERANAAADGAQLAVDYLRHLARHESTARRICRKIAIRFVTDDPSEELVARLSRVYLDSGTDIKAVLRELVSTDAFWASAGGKVRTPIDDVVATTKALGVEPKAPTGTASYVNELCWTIDSVLAFQWPRPDGPPDRAGSWASTTRMLNSWRMHWHLAGGFWPDGEVKFRKPKWYLPKKKVRFHELVDHVSRVVLGRPADDRLLKAACQATDIKRGDQITKSHPVMSYKSYRLLAVLLDSPHHMTR